MSATEAPTVSSNPFADLKGGNAWDDENMPETVAEALGGGYMLLISGGDEISIIQDPRHKPEKEVGHFVKIATGTEWRNCGKDNCLHCKANVEQKTKYTFLVWQVIVGKLMPKMLNWTGSRAGRLMKTVIENRDKMVIIKRIGSTFDDTRYEIIPGDEITSDIVAQVKESSVKGEHPYSRKNAPELWSVPF